MDEIDEVLTDWRACNPQGAVLTASRLDEALRRIAKRLESAANAARRDIQPLLVSQSEDKPPPLIQELRIDYSFELPGEGGPLPVVHFLYFWRGLGEISRRFRQFSADPEPLAEEACALRDALIRAHSTASLTRGVLTEELECAQEMSADPTAWDWLLESMLSSNWDSDDADSEVSLPEVSTLLLAWLYEVSEDYRGGERGLALKAFRDVTKIPRQEACVMLAAFSWDLEAALQGFFNQEADFSCGSEGWSSHGAKLRKNEVECPICVEKYDENKRRTVTRCCYQALCTWCATEITEQGNGVFVCPFCRTAAQAIVKRSKLADAQSSVGVGSAGSSRTRFVAPHGVSGRQSRGRPSANWLAQQAGSVIEELASALLFPAAAASGRPQGSATSSWPTFGP